MNLSFEDLETKKSTSFIDVFPKLVEEWNYEKNGSANQENIKPFSNKKYGGYVVKVMNGKHRQTVE